MKTNESTSPNIITTQILKMSMTSSDLLKISPVFKKEKTKILTIIYRYQ